MAKLYFIRIGGTAMGGVAAACQRRGDQVFGSETDLYEPMKSYLADHGVVAYPTFDAANLTNADPEVLVVGNAVSRGNLELEAALNDRRVLTSLPALVAERLIDRNTSVVITGTHGKTTTTSMTAWLLESAGRQPGYLIGGVPGNFTESCRPVPAELHNKGGVFVTEGDEYDSAFFDKRSKFLHYRPTIGVIHNIEFDHADIFENLEAIKKSFLLFARLVPQNGCLIANADDPVVRDLLREPVSPVAWVGLGSDAEWRAVSEATGSTTRFRIEHQNHTVAQIEFAMAGEHNLRNMLAACVVASQVGLTWAEIEAGARTFRPPKRRMEVIGEFQGATVVDDFAHHPTAIQASIRALQAQYPGRRLFVAFEPRSNTTTRSIFQAELAACFDGATGVVFGPTDRPWRYSESERLNMDTLTQALNAKGIQTGYVTVEESQAGPWVGKVYDTLRAWVKPGDVVAVFTNGNFGGLRERLTS